MCVCVCVCMYVCVCEQACVGGYACWRVVGCMFLHMASFTPLQSFRFRLTLGYLFSPAVGCGSGLTVEIWKSK